MGRHSQPDELDDVHAFPATAVKSSAVADLQLILHNPRLLAACLAAALMPFVCYFIVIAGLGDLHEWAVFLGVPLILAGVLVGAILDRAYERRR
jgi:hypothetical protein